MFLGRNNDLDFDVCKCVFNLDPKKYKWGVPFFSSDRNAAAIVNTEMAFREDETREEYEKELKHIASKLGWKSEQGLSKLFMVLLPDEICKAAVMACRKSSHKAIPLNIDKDHHECR